MADNIKFEDNSFEVKQKLEKIAMSWLDEAGGEMEAQVKRASKVGRVGGGQTKSNWQYKVNPSKQEVIIGNPMENALWEEFGTGDYALNGDGRKGGWFIHVGNNVGDISPQVVKAYGMKIYHGKGGQEFVFTRGKKPKRTLHKTFEKMKKKLIKALEAKLKGMN